MSGFQTSTNQHLIRAQVYSQQLKEVFDADLMGLKYVKMLSDFPDGEKINIPSIGQAEIFDFVEGQAVQYSAMDTGNFEFSIDQYKGSATYISRKMQQDSYYTAQLVAGFVPKERRALMVEMEARMLSVGPLAQIAGNTNTINGAEHRFIGSGTNEAIGVTDFAKALYALQVANVPTTNLVAIVDPSVEFTLNTQTNLSNVSNNPMWEGVISEGIRNQTGMRFTKNVYGFDVYVSTLLRKNTASETIGARTSTVGVNNLFFSAAPGDTLPIVGAVRQAPTVDSEFNKDLQREEYVTTCRYGMKLYRPENMIVVVTDTNVVV